MKHIKKIRKDAKPSTENAGRETMADEKRASNDKMREALAREGKSATSGCPEINGL